MTTLPPAGPFDLDAYNQYVLSGAAARAREMLAADTDLNDPFFALDADELADERR